MKNYACVIARVAFTTLLFVMLNNVAFGQAETQNTSFPFWKLKGNTNTDTSLNFVGTTDAKDLTFRTNNIRRVTIDANGNVGIGTIFPLQKFHINGLSNSLRVGGLATGGSFITTPASNTDKLLFADFSGDIKALAAGTTGQVLTIGVFGQPTWSSASGSDWSTTGNSGTNTTTNFIGTTDAADFAVKVNNIRAGFIERSTTNANTFIGSKAGNGFISGVSNALFGARAAEGWDGGDRNSIFGAEAGATMFGVTLSNNTLFGYKAGYAVFVNGISAFGTEAGSANRNGKFNTYVGFRAGLRNQDGSNNTFVGDSAGLSLNNNGSVDYQNVFIGAKAGLYPQRGADNTFIGFATGTFSDGSSNTFVGSQAASGIFGVLNLDGITALGYQAGYRTQGSKNTFAGYQAGYNNSTATSVTAVGYAAGFNSQGSNNTFIGDSAGYGGTSVTSQNTFIGSKAGREIIEGQNNVALGHLALSQYFNSNGRIQNTVAIGTEAGQESNQADNSVFVGYRSGYVGFNGSENIMIGAQVGAFNNGLTKNVLVGNKIASNSSSSGKNVVLGYNAAPQLDNSNENVVVGYNVGVTFSTNSKNVVIGANIPGMNSTTQSVIIGQLADGGFGGTSNTIIGNGASTSFGGLTNATALGAFATVSQDNALILGNNADVGIGTSTPARKLHVAGSSTGVRFEGLGTGGSFITTPSATTDRILYADANGDLRAITSGTTGQVLTYTAGGPAWSAAATSSDWSITGNSGTIDGTNFLGTTDNKPFNLRVFNQKAGRIDNTLRNSFYGYMAGQATSLGTDNTAMGDSALFATTTTVGVTAIGKSALRNSGAGIASTALGYYALYNLTNAQFNTAVGLRALYSSNANHNTAVGHNALTSATGGFNTGVGSFALAAANNTGGNNTAVGYNSLAANTSGSGNVAVGSSALLSGTGSADNAVVGYASGAATIGSSNSILGSQVAASVTVGSSNVLAGYLIPFNAASLGSNNIIAGAQTGNTTTGAIGDNNTFLGAASGINTTANSNLGNVTVGANVRLTDASATGISNTVAVGVGATTAGTTNNTIIGANSKSTAGTNTTALGANAQVTLNNNLILGDTISRPQVGIGVTAVGKTLTGTRFEVASESTTDNLLYRYQGTGTPTFNFQRSLGNLATPSSVAVSSTLGNVSFWGYDGNTWELAASITANVDSVVGDELVPSRIVFNTRFTSTSSLSEAMRIDKDGDVGIGTTNPIVPLHVAGGTDVSLAADNSGYFMIGLASGVNIAMDNNEIMARSNGLVSTLNLQTDGGALWMHSTGAVDADDFYVSTDANVRVGIGVGQTPAFQLELATNSAAKPTSTVWTVPSDERLKKDISPFKAGLNELLQINPVWYRYNGLAGLPAEELGVGTLAQEIEKVAPYMLKPFVDKDAEGKETEYKSVDYNAMLFMFVNGFKEQQKMIDDLKMQVQKQQQEIEKLKSR